MSLMQRDIAFLELANTVAKKARENGNTPFGAILVDAEGAGQPPMAVLKPP